MPKRKAPAKRKKKAAAPPPAQRRKRGRPVGTGFHPTKDQRRTVLNATGFGLTELQIAQLVINPETGSAISPVTLRAHFRAELDRGHAQCNEAVARGLFKNATTGTSRYPGGIPVTQIFWMKTRGRWSQAKPGDPQPDAPPPTAPEHAGVPSDVLTLARRVAFALAMGAREAAAAPAPVPEKKATA